MSQAEGGAAAAANGTSDTCDSNVGTFIRLAVASEHASCRSARCRSWSNHVFTLPFKLPFITASYEEGATSIFRTLCIRHVILGLHAVILRTAGGLPGGPGPHLLAQQLLRHEECVQQCAEHAQHLDMYRVRRQACVVESVRPQPAHKLRESRLLKLSSYQHRCCIGMSRSDHPS
jgi:hypothetical protein